MKTTLFLLRGTALAVGALLLGVAFDTLALSLFSFTAGCFVLLTVTSDYAPPPVSATPPASGAAKGISRRRSSSLPLAV